MMDAKQQTAARTRRSKGGSPRHSATVTGSLRAPTSSREKLGKPWQQFAARRLVVLSDGSDDHILAVVGRDVVYYRIKANGTLERVKAAFEDGVWSSPSGILIAGIICAVAIDRNKDSLHFRVFNQGKWGDDTIVPAPGCKLIGDPAILRQEDEKSYSIVCRTTSGLAIFRTTGRLGQFSLQKLDFDSPVLSEVSAFYMTKYIHIFSPSESKIRLDVFSIDDNRFTRQGEVLATDRSSGDIATMLVPNGAAKNRIEVVFQTGNTLKNYWVDESAGSFQSQTITTASMVPSPALIDIESRKLLVVLRDGHKMRSYTAPLIKSETSNTRKWTSAPEFGRAITSEPVLIRKRNRFDGRQYVVAVAQVEDHDLQYYWFEEDRNGWVAAKV